MCVYVCVFVLYVVLTAADIRDGWMGDGVCGRRK